MKTKKLLSLFFVLCCLCGLAGCMEDVGDTVESDNLLDSSSVSADDGNEFEQSEEVVYTGDLAFYAALPDKSVCEDKIIEVTDEYTEKFVGLYYIGEIGDDFYIAFSFEEKTDEVNQLAEGDIITIRGTCFDSDDDNLLLNHGELISVTKSEIILEPTPEATSVVEDTEKTEKESNKIVMPNSTADYIGSEWTIEMITEHFSELGFTNIHAEPCEPNEDNYESHIFDMVIESGWFSSGPWEAGDEFDPDAAIYVYYNEFPLLTIENCPDLVTILTSKDMDYMTFCNKYDGRYVEFDAYVIGHIEIEHIIMVSGGDYDGQTEVKYYSPSTYDGLEIYIGDRWGSSIDQSVKVGDHVTVSGRVEARWAEHFECVYVNTKYLGRR